MTLQRVLISNRGEIAIRIAHAADALGMESVAVFATSDDRSLHTRVATQSIALGRDGVDAYLDIESMIGIARSTGCDAVHPGYGFLSENAAFAAACESAGLTFVGPSTEALALFGSKVRARALATELGIPTVAGTATAVTAGQAAAFAATVGYPIMLKASAGGGGRGMRVVGSETDLDEAFTRSASEATAAFGDGSIFVEQLVRRPRHIEVQVLADDAGNVVHLFDRDCSVQQRNQKVVEIAPAPGLPDVLRAALHRDAVVLVKAAGYRNAGTVEFLIVPESGEYFFIECNPRIQVEHTVTEAVMGIDLVEAQLLIAGGASLVSLGLGDQQAVGSPRGYAVQARVVITGPGTMAGYKEPTGHGVRVDSCGYAGYTPPTHFDPLVAKVIAASVTPPTLEAALTRSRRAIAEFHIDGIPTNLGQLARDRRRPFGARGRRPNDVARRAPRACGQSDTPRARDHWSTARPLAGFC